LERNVREAIDEARILECAHDVFDTRRMLKVAQKLSGAPEKIVEKVYEDLLTIA
jgi:hypothetical protein